MAVDVAGLEVQIKSARQAEADANRINQSLTKLGRSGTQAQGSFERLSRESTKTGKGFQGLTRQTSSLEGGFAKLKRAAFSVKGTLAAVFAGLAVDKLIGINRAFGAMEASLVTVTGSADKAAEAFISIERFASRTPFSVGQLTDAFIKLNALGLEPSEAALESYGNTSSAMGKDLNQMIEAVADAATGEFERLKEFGIKARQEGDKVSLTFQGVTTQVGKNAQEITDYLQEIGRTQFAGAMERQAQTLNGAFSNAGDAVESLARTIGQSGVNHLVISIADAFRQSVDWVDRFIQRFRDAEKITSLTAVEEEIASVTGKMELFQERYERAIERLNRAVSMQGPQAMTSPHRQAVVDLVEQYQAWEQRLASLKDRQLELANTKLPAGPSIERETFTPSLATPKGMSEAEKAAKQLQSAYDSTSESLQRQIILHGENSAAATLNYEMQFGALTHLTQQQQNELMILAKTRDLQVAQGEAATIAARKQQDAQNAINQRMQETQQFMQSVGRSFSSAFEGAILQGKKFSDVLRGLAQDLIQLAFRQLVLKQIEASFAASNPYAAAGSFIKGLFAHEGGVIGVDALPSRQVPALAFAGAPRYHNGGIAGLAPDERPAVLRRGEEVLTQRDPRHRNNQSGGGPTVQNHYHSNIQIDARGAEQGVEVRIRAAVTEAVQQSKGEILRDMTRGGAFAKAVGRA